MSEHHETTALEAADAASPATSISRTSTDASHDTRRQDQRGVRGRGGRGGAGWRHKNMGRGEYNRHKDENHRTKRVKTGIQCDGEDTWGTAEGQHDADKKERKPKRKVAVMISYCGSGYKGMQLNPPHKSIEGDLFEAFVKAGAISQANSNDPKKSSIVRCARTDKGVHAAGNVISLKLIIEDPEVVSKINANLPDQIRVWDIIRTIGSFSSYQLCDSRKYEYLVPSHVFLPPHPESYLAKACLEYAAKENDLEGHLERQKEVEDWWPAISKKVDDMLKGEGRGPIDKAIKEASGSGDPWGEEQSQKIGKPEDPLLKKIREIHQQEKKAYRISLARLERVRGAFSEFVGTINFYNYTVDKSFKDASAKRHIKSFEVNDPIIINGTEWLSIHIHGQSFMMHQIRKMVGLVMMVIRTGCPVSRIKETFGPRKISIGKAPALGLLLEYPLFSHYNEKLSKDNGRDPLNFEKYKEGIDKFKEKFIYSKIFDEEEKQNTFAQFVQYLDSYKSPTYLYLTSAGFKVLDEAEARSDGKLSANEEPGNESDDEIMGGEG